MTPGVGPEHDGHRATISAAPGPVGRVRSIREGDA